MGRWNLRYVVALVALAAAGLVMAGGAVAAAPEPARMTSDGWALKSYGYKETGDFNACVTRARYELSQMLEFVLQKDNGFHLVFQLPQLDLDKNTLDQITLYIDERAIGRYTTNVYTETSFSITMTNTDGIASALKHGGQIAIRVHGAMLSYSLSGSLAALTELERCVTEGVAGVDGKPVAPPPTQQMPGIRQSASAKTPAPVVMSEPDEMVSESWTLEENRGKDNTGSFVCWILAEYRSTSGISFIINDRNVFEIFIVDPPFNLKVGSQVQVTLSVDGRDLGEYAMKTKSKGEYAIIQSNADRLITAFKHGRQFSLRFAGNVVRFSLKGTYAGLSNLERCAAKNKRTTEGRQADPIQANQGTGGSAAAPAATRTNPFLTKQGPAAAPVAPATITPPSASAAGPSARVLADRRRFFNHGAADDSAFINRLLDSVGLREFASIPPGSAQMFSDAAFYVWSDRLIEGGVTKVDLSVLSVAEAAKFMAENLDRLVCERGFDYRIRVVRMDSGASARRVNGLCLVGEHDLAVAMLP